MSSIEMINGETIPYIGQKDIMNRITHRIPNPVDIGIKCGQYISQGIFIFITIGSQRVKYRTIPILATRQTTAAFNDILDDGDMGDIR